jgi:hypothetical protein
LIVNDDDFFHQTSDGQDGWGQKLRLILNPHHRTDGLDPAAPGTPRHQVSREIAELPATVPAMPDDFANQGHVFTRSE